MAPYWDLTTLLFYIMLAMVGYWTFRRSKINELCSHRKQRIHTKPYLVWLSVWISAASFRYVAEGIGGSDAIEYIRFFDVCRDRNMPIVYYHYDILYRIFTQAVRIFTDNYHVFFMIFYSLLLFSYIFFLREFCPTDVSFAPFVLIFYIFLRGFTSFRTNLSVAAILFGLVLIKRKKYGLSALLMLASIFIHKASILYIMILPFYLFFKRKRLTVEIGIALTVAACAAGTLFRMLMMGGLGTFLGDAYASYASSSLESSFWNGFWKIAFEQMLLAGLMVAYRSKIQHDIKLSVANQKEQLTMIWIFCIFDFMLIPITYILNIWRGYEYLYLPRLIMWAEIIKIIKKSFSPSSRKYVEFIFLLAFIAWLIFRIDSTWLDSSLMPYIFAPLYNF